MAFSSWASMASRFLRYHPDILGDHGDSFPGNAVSKVGFSLLV